MTKRFTAEFRQAVAVSPRAEKALDDIERAADEFNRVYGSLRWELAHLDTQASMAGTPVEHVQAEISLLQILCGRRLAELLGGVIDSLNERRLLLATLAIRGVIDVTATLAYADRRVAGPLIAGVDAEQLREVLNMLRMLNTGGRFDWEKFIQGGEHRDALLRRYAKGDRPQLTDKQVNVWTMVKKLDVWVAEQDPSNKGQFLVVYDILCDSCHPSVGNPPSPSRTHDTWLIQLAARAVQRDAPLVLWHHYRAFRRRGGEIARAINNKLKSVAVTLSAEQ